MSRINEMINDINYSDRSERVRNYTVKRYPNQSNHWRVTGHLDYNRDRRPGEQWQEIPVPQELAGIFSTFEEAALAIYTYYGEAR